MPDFEFLTKDLYITNTHVQFDGSSIKRRYKNV